MSSTTKTASVRNTNAVNRTWWLGGPVGVYHKLGWEFGQADELLNGQEDFRPAAYQAMNACITAWSLVDWICADMDEKNGWTRVITLVGVEDSASFKKRASSFRELKICQQIANAAKHRSLGGGYEAGYSVHDELVRADYDGTVAFRRRMSVRFPGGDHDIRVVLHEVYKWWSHTLVELGYLA